MSKIRYKLEGDTFLAVESSQSHSGELEIIFDDLFDGRVIIGNTVSEIQDQKCPIALNILEDGVHLPLIVKDNKSFCAEAFYKRGNIAELVPLTWSDFRKMRERQYELEKEISILSDRVRELSNAVTHTTIF